MPTLNLIAGHGATTGRFIETIALWATAGWSILALGLCMVGAGGLYSRYSEELKDWL